MHYSFGSQRGGMERTDIFIEPVGSENSAGDEPAGADVDREQRGEKPDQFIAAYEGKLVVSVDMNDDEGEAVTEAFREAGAVEIGSA